MSKNEHRARPAAIRSWAPYVLLAAVVLWPGTLTATTTFAIVSTEATGGCRIAEVVANEVLVAHALETRDGFLSRLAPGKYSATARYFPPDTLWITLANVPSQVITIQLTAERTATNAEASAQKYQEMRGRQLPYDLSLAVDISPEKCTRKISLVPAPKDAWKNTALFKNLFDEGRPDVGGISYASAIELEVRRPEYIEFRVGAHSFTRSVGYWRERLGDEIVAEYDEFERHLAGFDVRDRRPAEVMVLGRPVKVPRIVQIPSGFKFWTTPARSAITLYRPTEAVLLPTALRAEGSRPTAIIAAKSFIKKIIVDEVIPGQPLPATSSQRLGFDHLVGGRVHALEFALATDALFSENPTTRFKETDDYRLWSELKLIVQCAGSTIRWLETPRPTVAFGREGPLDAAGKLAEPITVEATPSLPDASSVRIEYTVMGRPNLAALASFNAIKPRTCSWIWHRVSARIACVSSQLNVFATIQGSNFPSHRLWTNEIVSTNIEQKSFDRLWKCRPGEPEIVE
jgi:hypothetical protein